MKKINCWELNKCGREPGGVMAARQGVCPAAIEERLCGVNGGVNGGRACWMVDDTLFGSLGAGYWESKLRICGQCEFLARVRREEGDSWIWHPDHSPTRKREKCSRLDSRRVA